MNDHNKMQCMLHMQHKLNGMFLLHLWFFIIPFSSLHFSCLMNDAFHVCTNLCGGHLSIKGKISLFTVSLLSQTDQNNSKRQAKKMTETQHVNPWKCIYRQQRVFITTNGTNGNAPVFSVSYTLSDNTTDKVGKKPKEKSRRKVSEPNRLRGSLNLWTVTLKC